MVVMQSGVIEEMGEIKFSSPKTDYTKLIDAIPEGKLDDIKKRKKKRCKINKQEV